MKVLLVTTLINVLIAAKAAHLDSAVAQATPSSDKGSNEPLIAASGADRTFEAVPASQRNAIESTEPPISATDTDHIFVVGQATLEYTMKSNEPLIDSTSLVLDSIVKSTFNGKVSNTELEMTSVSLNKREPFDCSQATFTFLLECSGCSRNDLISSVISNEDWNTEWGADICAALVDAPYEDLKTAKNCAITSSVIDGHLEDSATIITDGSLQDTSSFKNRNDLYMVNTAQLSLGLPSNETLDLEDILYLDACVAAAYNEVKSLPKYTMSVVDMLNPTYSPHGRDLGGRGLRGRSYYWLFAYSTFGICRFCDDDFHPRELMSGGDGVLWDDHTLAMWESGVCEKLKEGKPERFGPLTECKITYA